MGRIIIKGRPIYVSPCHLLDASFDYFAHLLFPERYGFQPLPQDEKGLYIPYEMSDDETEEGVE
jgi:hypothetical protein